MAPSGGATEERAEGHDRTDQRTRKSRKRDMKRSAASSLVSIEEPGHQKPRSTTLRRERCSSSEQRFPEANAVRHRVFRTKSCGREAVVVDTIIKVENLREVPLWNHRNGRGV